MTAATRVPAGEWLQRARALRDEGWWLADLTGLDTLSLARGSERRFEVIVQLLHQGRKERQTIYVPAEGDPATVPSVVEVWPGADFPERETYDMFGVHFEGHPDLKRILMPDEWEGHPLRKDYGVGKVTIEYKPQPFLQIDTPNQGVAAQEAGVEVDRLGQIEMRPGEASNRGGERR